MNLICIGAQKSATTSLAKALKEHPQIAKSTKKELHYFDREGYKKFDESKYNSFFLPGDYIYKPDFTPSYLYVTDTAKRIHEAFNDNVKIIVLLRNPIDRAISQYLMIRRRGLEKLSFEKAFEEQEKRTSKDFLSNIYYSYFKRGLYHKQLSRYFKLFPKENILILKFDDFIKKQDQELTKIYKFLNIDEVEYVEETFLNKGSVPFSYSLNKVISKISALFRKTCLADNKALKKIKRFIVSLNRTKKSGSVVLNDKFRKVLKEYYKEDLNKLKDYIDFDISEWM
jgi:hypothetical protein